MTVLRQFFRFGLVGAAGFLVDVSVLYYLRHLGLDLYSARVVSFVAAATATWIGNRLFTFRQGSAPGRHLGKEWTSYLAAMAIGGLINYTVYAMLVKSLPLFHEQPWMAVAAGTGAGMLFNFLTARKILSRREP